MIFKEYTIDKIKFVVCFNGQFQINRDNELIHTPVNRSIMVFENYTNLQ